MNTNMINKTVCGLLAAGAIVTCSTQAGEINEWLTAKGDVRFRFETIDKDGSETRERFRVRGRLAITGKASEKLKVGLRLASGSDDPVSTNQTLGDGFSSKGLQLDRAFLAYTLGEGASIEAGKIANPFESYKGLVWDSDLNPEGIALSYETDSLRTVLGGFAVEEEKSGDDIYLFGAQAVASAGDEVKGELGVSYYLYSDLQGEGVLVDEEDSFGNNSVEVLDDAGEVTGLNYVSDFSVFELFGKVSTKVADIPVALYADYILNTEADDDTGYLAGITIGKAKAVGSWQFDVNFRNVEADATIGAFSDSDAAGGGTDIETSRFQFKYQLAENLQFAATWFDGEQSANGNGTDYQRGQFDVIAKF